MKKFYLLLTLLNTVMAVWAQIPQRMSYQAVVRDKDNKMVVNRPVGVRISILQGSEKGTRIFSEIYNPLPETNANGLLTLEIGGGIPLQGKLAEIDWSAGPYFILTETDPSGGNNYMVTGTSPLLSVPFAFHAFTVENDKVDDADNDPVNEIQQLSLSGTVLSLSQGGGTVNLPSSGGGGDNWGTQSVVSDLTLDGAGTGAYPLKLADNAVTVAKISTGAITESKIADGAVTAGKIAAGAISADKIANGAVNGTKIAQSGASTGQVLKWDGSQWTPGDDKSGTGGFSLPYEGNVSSSGNVFSVENQGSGGGIRASTPTGVGIYGNTTGSSGLGYGVMGSSNSTDGRGIYGEASNSSGSNYGIFGRSASNAGYGVFGWVTGTSGTNYGVSGLSNSTSGRGVYGEASSATGINYGVYGKTNSTQGYGVYGVAESTTGNTLGVMGENKSSTGTAVYGVATNNAGLNYGVLGKTSSSSGRGVYGEASNATGITFGVAGTSRSSTGFGVFGRTSSTTGLNCGVYGESESSQGRAVYGVAKSSTGRAYGVYGRSESFGGGVGVVGINNSIPTGTVLDSDPKPIGVYGEVAYDYGYSGYFKGGFVYVDAVFGIGGFSSKELHVQGGASKTEGGSSWMVWSDERLKTITGEYSRGLSEIASLNPVVFRYKENNPVNLPSHTEQVGYIAQEVQKFIPEAVSEGPDGYLELNIDPINIALVNAIKELKRENEILRSENQSINIRLESLEKFVASTPEKEND